MWSFLETTVAPRQSARHPVRAVMTPDSRERKCPAGMSSQPPKNNAFLGLPWVLSVLPVINRDARSHIHRAKHAARFARHGSIECSLVAELSNGSSVNKLSVDNKNRIYPFQILTTSMTGSPKFAATRVPDNIAPTSP